MKYIIILLLISRLTTYAQEDSSYTFQTQKETYKIGELVISTLKSEKSFTLKTTGDCQANILPPSFIKKIDGEWKEPYAVKQMCCGLPCTMNAISEMTPQMKMGMAGTFKIVVYTCSGIMTSNEFKVME